MIAIFLAYILHILIECPINNLIKLMLNFDKKCDENYDVICMTEKVVIDKKKQYKNEFKFIFPVD